jgi:hypothetical protein
MMNQVRRFTWTDYLLVFGVFIVGFVFSMILNNYRNSTNEKIAEISKRFQGLKGEYEYVQLKYENAIKWRFRVKFLEKVYLIILLAVGFIAYKSPSVIGFLLYDQPHISISLFALSVLGFSLANYLIEKRAIKSEG